jgi:phage I-like protein
MCRQDGGLEKFKGFLDKAPIVAAPSTIEKKDPPAGGTRALDQAQRDLCRQMGITEEAFAKSLNS